MLKNKKMRREKDVKHTNVNMNQDYDAEMNIQPPQTIASTNDHSSNDEMVNELQNWLQHDVIAATPPQQPFTAACTPDASVIMF